MKYANELETKDLILKKATQQDLNAIFKNYWSSEKTAQFMLWEPLKSLEQAQERLNKIIDFQKDHLLFFVHEKSTGEAIGQAAMLEIEPNVYEDAGIGLGENFVGHGYGKQILNCFVEYLFEKCNAQKIICSCFASNTPSAKMQQSCGLKYAYSKTNTRKRDGLIYDANYYVITKEDWQKATTQNLN